MPHPQTLRQTRSRRARERAEWRALCRQDKRLAIKARERREAENEAKTEKARLLSAQYRALRVPIEAETNAFIRDLMIKAISQDIRDKVMTADIEL